NFVLFCLIQLVAALLVGLGCTFFRIEDQKMFFQVRRRRLLASVWGLLPALRVVILSHNSRHHYSGDCFGVLSRKADAEL
ncbi:MAG: hypothetical protein KGI50_07995, partial [Patescibacteria group bacterium]|nr:hypothetical protein [Patescibacteria group bacterium]